MDVKPFLDALAHVNSIWSMAAFTIAAILIAMKQLLASPSATRRRGKAASPLLASPVVWPIVVIICIVGALPILAHTYLESQRLGQRSVFRVRVAVLDPQGHPTTGATLRTTASNETTVTSQGIGTITIAPGALPADGTVTIYADLESSFLHGRTDLRLAADPNPSVTIKLEATRDAVVTGLVEDENGRAIAGAAVHIVGGGSGATGVDGSFTMKANAAIGQTIRIHVEKPGYAAVDQDHPAGRDPVTIVLPAERRRSR